MEVPLTKHKLTITFTQEDQELYPEYKVECLGKKSDTSRQCYYDGECSIEAEASNGYLSEIAYFYEKYQHEVVVWADNVETDEEPLWEFHEVIEVQ